MMLGIFLWAFAYTSPTLNVEMFTYYTENFIQDTGAYNAVAAILLNYRLFDTLFEALMLLISVIGIIYFSRHGGEDHG